MKKTIHQDSKKIRQNYLIAKDGHNARIKENKLTIKSAKKAIKMHKLLIKQSKVTLKLQELELQ